MKMSLLTIVRGRKTAIHNMIKALNINGRFPDELIVVHMNEDIYHLTNDKFPIREYSLLSEHALPLAQARNYAARQASYHQLIFLDADCMPAADFLEAYEKAFSENEALVSGRVAYLPLSAMSAPDLLLNMEQYGIADPVRGKLDQYPYYLFWSLNFGCSKKNFEKIGGFDESFTGYGAEDTDFGFSAHQQEVDFLTIDAWAYHQYHQSYDPPVNHLQAIVQNATTFREKWGSWPMEGWFNKFQSMGYVEFTADKLQIIRLPDHKQIASALKST